MANPIKIIRQFIEVEDQVGDFIANGPSDGIGGYVRDRYRHRCNEFANLPGWARALTAGSGGSVGRICKPYYDQQGADGPQRVPPFTGGQCAGVQYQVTGRRINSNGTVSSTFNYICPSLKFGPITPRDFVEGTQKNFGFDSSNSAGERVFTQVWTGGPTTEAKLEFTSVSRCDGQPDECGDPPGDLQPGPNPPPDPGPLPGPEPTDNPNSPIPFLPIPPYDDPIGGPTPIEPPTEEPLPVEPQPIPGNPDTDEGGPENVGDPVEVDPGSGGGGGDTLFGPPPDGRVWVGALLQFQIPSAYGIIPGSAPANPVTARVFANASLVFASGRGTPIRVNGGNIDLFRANGAMQVLGVYVNCLPGITYNVRPVSVEKCPENQCSVE